MDRIIIFGQQSRWLRPTGLTMRLGVGHNFNGMLTIGYPLCLSLTVIEISPTIHRQSFSPPLMYIDMSRHIGMFLLHYLDISTCFYIITLLSSFFKCRLIFESLTLGRYLSRYTTVLYTSNLLAFYRQM